MSSIFSESSLAIWAGLAGFVSGLVMKKIGYFRRFQAILIAVGINLVFGFFFSIFKYQSFDSSDATRWIFWTSTFLISIMLILAPRVGPRQFSEGQQLPQTHQGLGAAGNILWFFQIWWTALTKPKETNYSELVENQKPSWLKAYWWAFATGFVGGVLGFLVTGDFYLDSNNLIITFLI